MDALTRPTEGRRTLYAPRLPADPFARSAVCPQRNLLAAQSPRSAVSIIPSKPGRAQGWAKGPKKRAQGPRGGQGAQGAARAARAHGRTRASRAGALRAPGPLRGPGGALLWGPWPWVPPLGPPRFARNNRNCAARKLRCEYAALRRNCAACKWVGGHARSVTDEPKGARGGQP